MDFNIRRKLFQWLPITFVIAVLFVLLALLMPSPSAYALPEYGNRTGEPCATCHVSPGGAGPLTLRGLLWVAEGRQNDVPTFENVLLAPGLDDPAALYEVACAPCHGLDGEGLSGSALAGYDFSKSLVRRSVVEGVPFYNMPAFEGQFTDEQLEALVEYVSDMSGGRVELQESYPVPEGKLTCTFYDAIRCWGN